MALQDNLVAAYNMIEGANPAIAYDLSGNGKNITLTNMTWGDGGLIGNAANEIGSIPNGAGNDIIESDIGTFLIRLKSYAAFADGANHRIIGAAGVPGYMYISKAIGNTLKFVINNGTTDRSVDYTTGSIPGWTTGVQLAIQWDKATDIFDSKKLALNVNGSYATPSASGNATSLDTFTMPSTFTFFNHHADSARYMDAVCEYLYIWKRVLTAAECLAVYNNPSIVLAAIRKKSSYSIPIFFS